MVIKEIIDEDFCNYKSPSMYIAFPYCTFKCDRESEMRVCQNSTLSQAPDIEMGVNEICERYISNDITSAIVCSGLEPMESFEDLYDFIYSLRCKYNCDDTVVIYTGYTEDECIMKGWIEKLSSFKHIIIKFGRFRPNQEKHFDDILGIYLASDNQYAEKIS